MCQNFCHLSLYYIETIQSVRLKIEHSGRFCRERNSVAFLGLVMPRLYGLDRGANQQRIPLDDLHIANVTLRAYREVQFYSP